MYKVTAYFKEGKAFNYFKNVYDAIDFKDDMDAHYPIRTDLEKVKTMREFVYTSWNSVMNAEVNPLRHIPDHAMPKYVKRVHDFPFYTNDMKR